MTKPQKKILLPGIGMLGKAYDVQGLYADPHSLLDSKTPLFTFINQIFEPDLGENALPFTIYEKVYFYPSIFSTTRMGYQKEEVVNTRSMRQTAIQNKESGSATGFYEGFQASVDASFEASYQTNASFYSFLQKGYIASYRVALPSLSELQKNWLTEDAQQAINGSMSAADVVKDYGTHFMYSGIMGGTLNYSQSISKYSTESEAKAEATISANYMHFVGAKMSSSISVDSIQTSEQSNATFEAKGGVPSALDQGYQIWANTVQQGDFALIDFEKDSLQPISVFAADPDRANELDEAIAMALGAAPLPQMQTLRWDADKTAYHQYGKDKDAEVELKLSNTNEVIVGFTARVSSSNNVTRMACRVLNLDDNSMTWRVAGDRTSYNATDYEAKVDIPQDTGNRGIAVTGIGLRSHHSNLSNIVLHYQKLDPVDEADGYLDANLSEAYAGDALDEYEVNFTPDPGEGLVIVGIGVGVKDDNFDVLNLYRAPLVQVNVDVA